jgi:hypothetical protein
MVAVEALDGEADVRAVEAAHEHLRVAEAEPLDDLVAHRRRRRRRERQDRRPSQRLGGGGELQVVGAEVVAPLGDAVGFVDDEQRRARRRQLAEHVGVRELLGRQQQELEGVLGQLGERPLALGRREG